MWLFAYAEKEMCEKIRWDISSAGETGMRCGSRQLAVDFLGILDSDRPHADSIVFESGFRFVKEL